MRSAFELTQIVRLSFVAAGDAESTFAGTGLRYLERAFLEFEIRIIYYRKGCVRDSKNLVVILLVCEFNRIHGLVTFFPPSEIKKKTDLKKKDCRKTLHGNSKVETLSICRAHNLLYFILDLFYSTKQVLCPEQTVPSSLRIMLVLSKVGT